MKQIRIKKVDPHDEYSGDVEATKDDLRSVGYTAASLIGILGIIISFIIYILI